MEALALAAATLLAKSFVGSFADSAAKATWGGFAKLGEVIRSHLGTHRGAQAVEDLRSAPDDPERIAAVADAVKVAAEGNPEFAAALTALVNDANRAGVIDQGNTGGVHVNAPGFINRGVMDNSGTVNIGVDSDRP